MLCVFACALTFALVATAPATAASAAAAPAPNLQFQLEKQNRSRPWLRVTTDSGRFDLHADGLDAFGLHGFEAHRNETPLPHDPLAWSEIHRLDQVVTRGHRYGTIGAVVLGLLCAGLGNALGAPSDNGGSEAMIGLAVGGAAGAWLGASYGNRFQSEVNWYTAPPPSPKAPPPTDVLSMAAALADSAHVDSTSALAAADSTREPPAPPEALALAARIGPDDLIRVSGDFHAFQGRAHVAGPGGLERLVVDHHAPREWRPDPVPERLSWSAIAQVETRHSNAGRVAAGTALVFGISGALVSAAAVGLADSPNVTPGGAAIQGGALMALIGAVVGAGIGTASHHWSVVYHRP